MSVGRDARSIGEAADESEGLAARTLRMARRARWCINAGGSRADISTVKQPDYAFMLRLTPLFGGLPPQLIERLAAVCVPKSLRAGETLFRRDDPGDALYGVRRGQIAIEAGSKTGQRHTLAFVGPGDVCGEIAVLDGGGRTADAVATQPSELFKLRRPDLLGLLMSEPAFGVALLEMLCRRLRELSAQNDQVLTMRLEARLRARLVLLATDFGDEIRITQEQLARSVGASRESVNRQLRLWEDAGVLAIGRGQIDVIDRRALQAT